MGGNHSENRSNAAKQTFAHWKKTLIQFTVIFELTLEPPGFSVQPADGRIWFA